MQIVLRNRASISNKYIRFIKWKLYGIGEKFNNLLYVEVYLNSEGQHPRNYKATIKLGVQGRDIVLNNSSQSLSELFKKSFKDVNRYLAKKKKIEVKARKSLTQVQRHLVA
jgi:ribosome-associated translation inhibitor RaiA